MWASLQEALGWGRSPESFEDFFDHWLPLGCPGYNFKIFLLGVVLWVLWNVRNKLHIEGVAPKTPSNILYMMLSLLQRWSVLLRRPEKLKMDDLSTRVWDLLKRFHGGSILVRQLKIFCSV
jgi:hypothetical protein